MEKNLNKATICVHGSGFKDEVSKGVVTPIYPSTCNGYTETNSGSSEVMYPRYMNMPSQLAVSNIIAKLEKAETALVTSSGMSAITSTLFALLKKGDHALFQGEIYGGTTYLLEQQFEKFGIEYTYVSSTEVSDFESAIKENTRLIYIETPSNPILSIVDLRKIAAMAKRNNLLTVIDNTFASPVNQLPIELGIDVSIHSATKYLNGHSDLNCGAIATSNKLMESIKKALVTMGGTLNAQDCYLLERGIKTLFLRVNHQNKSAQTLAEFLEAHGKVKKVNYPGLKSHKDHEIAKSQMSGFGGMLSFELEGTQKEADKFSENLNLIKQVGSLGGVETVLSFPAKASHAKMTPELRAKAGISDTLIRLSVGIEDIDDLINEFESILKQI